MPCRDYYPDDQYYADLNRTKDRINNATNAACTAINHLIEATSEQGAKNRVGADVWEWWEAHKEADAKRIDCAKERILEINALMDPYKKLSVKERKTLGINGKYHDLRKERDRLLAEVGADWVTSSIGKVEK